MRKLTQKNQKNKQKKVHSFLRFLVISNFKKFNTKAKKKKKFLWLHLVRGTDNEKLTKYIRMTKKVYGYTFFRVNYVFNHKKLPK